MNDFFVHFSQRAAYVLRKGTLIARIGLQASDLIRNDLPEPCLECLRLPRNRIGTEASQNQGMVSFWWPGALSAICRQRASLKKIRKYKGADSAAVVFWYDLVIVLFMCFQAKSYHDAWRQVAHNQCVVHSKWLHTCRNIDVTRQFPSQGCYAISAFCLSLGTTKLRWQRASYSKTLLGWE